MTITYRDGLGYVAVIVSEYGVDFMNGCAYFESGSRSYCILADNIVSII